MKASLRPTAGHRWHAGTGQPFTFTFAREAGPAKPVRPSDIQGTWLGVFRTGSGKLRNVFHISNTEQDLHAMLDSPDQAVTGITVNTVARNGQAITM